MTIIQRAHQHPQPFGLSEVERRGDGPFCVWPPVRGSRNESLEALRYLTLTMQDLIKVIQDKWPPDRPQPVELQDHLTFGAFALKRVRNGALRRMAESALLHSQETAQS